MMMSKVASQRTRAFPVRNVALCQLMRTGLLLALPTIGNWRLTTAFGASS